VERREYRTIIITNATINSSGAHTNTGSSNGVGQYTVGLFRAASTSQVYTVTGNSSTQMNAIQLRDITNIGYWTGNGNTTNTWDAATTNSFASNFYTAALANTNFGAAKILLTPNAVTFADAYWDSGATTTVTQNSVSIAAGGDAHGILRHGGGGAAVPVGVGEGHSVGS